MSDDMHPKDLAAAYALGALDPDDREQFEAWLAADPELRDEVTSYRELLAHIALGVAPVSPPARLRDSILQRVRGAHVPTDEASSRPAIVAYERLDWEPSDVAGLTLHWIRRGDPETGNFIVLMRGEPGTRYPDHQHTAEEHGFILQGSFRDARGEYHPGDYIHYAAGSIHRDILVTSPDVCFFLVISGPIETLETVHSG